MIVLGWFVAIVWFFSNFGLWVGLALALILTAVLLYAEV